MYKGFTTDCFGISEVTTEGSTTGTDFCRDDWAEGAGINPLGATEGFVSVGSGCRGDVTGSRDLFDGNTGKGGEGFDKNVNSGSKAESVFLDDSAEDVATGSGVIVTGVCELGCSGINRLPAVTVIPAIPLMPPKARRSLDIQSSP